jgi:hypothetical protein
VECLWRSFHTSEGQRLHFNPIQPKAGAMLADNGSGCNQDEGLLPFRPESSQSDPEQLVYGSESPPRLFGVESQQLLTQGKVFEDEVLAGTERSNNPSEEVPKQQNHGRILSDDSKTAPSPSC